MTPEAAGRWTIRAARGRSARGSDAAKGSLPCDLRVRWRSSRAAANGIGRACAEAFAAEGAAVAVADVDADARHARSRSAIEAGGGRAAFIATDVGDAGQAGRLVEQTLAAFGRLDVLINNAGIIKTADFLEISEADFDAVLRVNLKGVFLVGQAAARAMVEGARARSSTCPRPTPCLRSPTRCPT